MCVCAYTAKHYRLGPVPLQMWIPYTYIILLLCVYVFNVFSGPDTRVGVIGGKKSNEQLMTSRLELRTVERTYLYLYIEEPERRMYLLWVHDREKKRWWVTETISLGSFSRVKVQKRASIPATHYRWLKSLSWVKGLFF